MRRRVTTRTTQIMNPHLRISKCGITVIILWLVLSGFFTSFPFSHSRILFSIFAALGGGEEDLLKQSSLGPILTCQMTKSKLITVSPHSGILQYDTPSGKPMHSSQTSVC